MYNDTRYDSRIGIATTHHGGVMGMRCDQHKGLTKAAKELVEGERVLAYTEHVERIYPDGGEEQFSRDVYRSSVVRSRTDRSYQGMFGDEYPLFKYTFLDGKVYYEAVQSEPWSSGPCFFLALKDEEGNWVEETLWSEEDIRNA